MKFTPLAASFLALALFAVPAYAQETAPAEGQPAVDAASPQIPEEVMNLLNDSRPLAELSVEDLVNRAKQARKFSKMDSLAPDVQQQLASIAQAARAEIAAREQANQQPAEQPVEKAAEQPVEKAAEQPAEQQPAAEAEAPQAAEVPAEVMTLLADQRPASELSNEELAARAKQARSFAKMKGLSDDLRGQLQNMAKAARGEIAAREQAVQQKQPEAAPEAPAVTEAPKAEEAPAVTEAPKTEEAPAVTEAPKAEEAPAVTEAPKVEEAAPAETASPQPGELPADVAALLNDTRAPSEMTPEELNARLKAARQFSKSESLPEDVRNQLAQIAKAARGELLARESGQKTPDAPVEAAVPPPPPAVIEVAPTTPLPPPPAVVEVPATPAPAPVAAAPAVDAKQAQQLDGNAGNPEAEAKAQEFLLDPRAADKLSDADLKARLDGMRDLMAGNQLSRATERDLRKKLRTERDVLRQRVAQAAADEAAKSQTGNQQAAKPLPPSSIDKKDYNFNIEIVLNDRRPSDELQDYELRRRLEVYRQAAYDRRYEEQQRGYWRAVMERDQYLLQQRLLRERRDRQANLDQQFEDDQFDFELDDSNFDEDQTAGDVYAAEVDDEELQDVLVAPPRKKITRRYTVKEVEASPDLRQALPRVEIDTVRFGFNEAFVRAEEVANLDRIAEIMERVLRKSPREVFLIEGHTDAVGSDAANLKLSRERAVAIKKALTTYYVIPPKNLETVGYGERYLKIPTAEAEQENRRVSVSRATALIGELDE
jgi:outer membrane protein OmpA-like peptidoglycan-associated protein